MPGLADLLAWSAWRPLRGCWLGDRVPARPGLYRIRRAGRDDLDYVGQTGATLRIRMGMLRGVYGSEMPYRDPHTAGPALWALRQATGCDFEVSIVPVDGPTPRRKALEALAIALYRRERGRSPTVNFGRMPTGYRMSSGNYARLVAAGRRSRGGPSAEPDASHRPSIAPIGPLGGDPQAPDWCGHPWSGWLPIGAAIRGISLPAAGLYRIRAADRPGLLYVGEGSVPSRLLSHLAKARRSGHSQAAIFGGSGPLECSWVIDPSWASHQRLELENDLIAAHVLATGAAPAAQFLGEQ